MIIEEDKRRQYVWKKCKSEINKKGKKIDEEFAPDCACCLWYDRTVRRNLLHVRPDAAIRDTNRIPSAHIDIHRQQSSAVSTHNSSSYVQTTLRRGPPCLLYRATKLTLFICFTYSHMRDGKGVRNVPQGSPRVSKLHNFLVPQN